MDQESTENAMKHLLKFMQYEVESEGCSPELILFNFSPKFTQYYIGTEPQEIQEGENLTKLRNQTGLDNQIIAQAINSASLRGYINAIDHHPQIEQHHYNALHSKYLKLSSLGYMMALTVTLDDANKQKTHNTSSNNKDHTEIANQRGKARHGKTEKIKEEIIKPMFANKELIKGKNIRARSDKICEKLSYIFQRGNKELQQFASKYNLNYQVLQESALYFAKDKSETVYN